jgi:hypothetical protein
VTRTTGVALSVSDADYGNSVVGDADFGLGYR